MRAGAAGTVTRWVLLCALALGVLGMHHRGAVEVARTRLDRGADPGAEEPARRVVGTQESEIREVEALLPRG